MYIRSARPMGCGLAAAYIASERRPSSLEVVTLADRLAAAARKEGFAVDEIKSAE